MNESATSGLPERSSFVTAIAWILIAVSVLMLASACMQALVSNLMAAMPPMPQGFDMKSMVARMPPSMRWPYEHPLATGLATAIAGLVLLASSVGLLKRRAWARPAVIACLGASIVLRTAMLYLTRDAMREFPWDAAGMDLPADVRAQMESMASAMSVVQVAMSLGVSALAAWVIWKLMSAKVAAEFRAEPELPRH